MTRDNEQEKKTRDNDKNKRKIIERDYSPRQGHRARREKKDESKNIEATGRMTT